MHSLARAVNHTTSASLASMGKHILVLCEMAVLWRESFDECIPPYSRGPYVLLFAFEHA